jgi:hypothetical protein
VAGTLAAPMVAQVRRRLREEERGSRFAADLTLRHGHDGAWDVVVPQGALRGGSGEALLSLGKVRVSGSGSTTPRFAGNFATGGKGLPRIDGTMERQGRGGAQFHLAMADYAVGGGRLAVPELVVVQMPDGALGFSGETGCLAPFPAGGWKTCACRSAGPMAGTERWRCGGAASSPRSICSNWGRWRSMARR